MWYKVDLKKALYFVMMSVAGTAIGKVYDAMPFSKDAHGVTRRIVL